MARRRFWTLTKPARRRDSRVRPSRWPVSAFGNRWARRIPASGSSDALGDRSVVGTGVGRWNRDLGFCVSEQGSDGSETSTSSSWEKLGAREDTGSSATPPLAVAVPAAPPLSIQAPSPPSLSIQPSPGNSSFDKNFTQLPEPPYTQGNYDQLTYSDVDVAMIGKTLRKYSRPVCTR